MAGWRERAEAFCASYGLRVPILLAPMAGACPPALSAAVASAGGLGACGALLMTPDQIGEWARTVRAASNGAFQINLWVPGPAPVRDPAHEAEVRRFLARFGPEPTAEAGDAAPPDFDAQFEALLQAGTPIVSSIMGLFSQGQVRQLKHRGVAWFAVATTVSEALEAEAAGADVIVAQGMEAGGHRGGFDAGTAARRLVGLVSLVPAIVDAVRVPVVATGGLADARGIAAAFALGASAVQIGTGLLRCPEADIGPAWADALASAKPEDTAVSRAFSGRPGRSLLTSYVVAATAPDAPDPAPYPVQRGLTAPMRAAAKTDGDVDRMQAWAGQSAGLASAEPAADLVARLWAEAQTLMP